MGDLKLSTFLFTLVITQLENSANFIIWTVFDPLLYNYYITYDAFVQNLTSFTAFKFLSIIAFLILIRGGTPRYRYDYLTKLGWLKFLSLSIHIFIFVLLYIFLF